MTDEVRAALGRWRRRPAGVYGRDAGGVTEAAVNAARLDACALADAMVALHPADEDEPATGARLGPLGFYRHQQSAAANALSTWARVCDADGTVTPVVAVEFPRVRRGEVPVWRVWVYGHPREFNECPTVGYFRRLLAALGLEVRG